MGKESIVQVYIEVLDENDNAPEFAQPYEPKVCENAAQGKVSWPRVEEMGDQEVVCFQVDDLGENLPAHLELPKYKVTT